MKRLLTLLLLSGLLSTGFSQLPTHWRGPTGNGIYSESGLMTSWPVDGPEVLWAYEQLGIGHSSPVVSQGFLYTSGMVGETGMLFKFDLEGNLIWKKPYGPEFNSSYTGPRGAPVVVGDHIYLESGTGELYCLTAGDGSIIWKKDLFKDFDGKNITWGVNETPLVDGDIIYATPGGKNNNVVALDRHSGDMVWSSKGKGELSAYCSPLMILHNGRKILVTHTASHLIGLDAGSGDLLWAQKQPNEYGVHANTPVYHNGVIFYFSGYGQGGGSLVLSMDGSSITQSWFSKKLDSRMGGAVLVDGYIYMSGDYAREWRCVEWETGKEMYASSELGKGVVIYADGMLYCYTDRGELALVKADPSGFKVISKTKVMKGSEQHWAHPMIHEGVLYVRHGSAIIAYKVK
ncbi:MAG: PQQ-like beta-propeller repeat protein [Bacteroides sp.]|nr:PQQ-like beta-propeller repeat protein [Bacteroides sp.]